MYMKRKGIELKKNAFKYDYLICNTAYTSVILMDSG